MQNQSGYSIIIVRGYSINTAAVVVRDDDRLMEKRFRADIDKTCFKQIQIENRFVT